MKETVESFIKNALEKDRAILNAIFEDLKKNYSHESKRQHVVRAVVAKFEHDFPKVMSEFDSEIKKKKELANNKYSSSNDTDLRQVFAIPDGMLTRINQLFDKIGEKESFLHSDLEQAWMAKNYPRYLVPEKY